MNCEGNVLLDKGLQGVSIADDMFQGFKAGLQNVCGDKIKVVGEFFGQFGPGPLAQVMPGLLASNPDIDAVFVDTTPGVVVKAFRDAGREVPDSCFRVWERRRGPMRAGKLELPPHLHVVGSRHRRHGNGLQSLSRAAGGQTAVLGDHVLRDRQHD